MEIPTKMDENQAYPLTQESSGEPMDLTLMLCVTSGPLHGEAGAVGNRGNSQPVAFYRICSAILHLFGSRVCSLSLSLPLSLSLSLLLSVLFRTCAV